MIYGERIRNLRQERKLSLKELSRKSGLSVSYLSEVERGRKTPSLNTIDKLCNALNISSREFVQDYESNYVYNDGQCIQLGQRIKLHREEQGVNQTELSRSTGFSLSYICEIEQGNVFPSVSALSKIASVMGINVKDLLGSPGSLGSKIRTLREEQGMNQAQLAKQTGLSHGLIGQLERGKVQPSLKTLEKLSGALNISPCYLISEGDDLQELLNILSPETKELLRDPNVQSVLRTLRDCSEKEIRFILDFIKMFKQSEICD